MRNVNIKDMARAIFSVLESCGYDDITEAPHYAIYVSYEDDSSDWKYTDDLSIDELEKKLEELSR